MKRYSWGSRGVLVGAILLLGIWSGCAARSADDGQRAEALVLYEEGRFAEARIVLEELDETVKLDGPMLYRLAYSQRTTGAPEAADATEQRAKTQLEKELPKAKRLEVPFYLVNTYQNLGLSDEKRRVAGETIERVEKGKLGGDSSLDQFRIGKLYADVGREDDAATWYARSLEAVSNDGTLPAYAGWASRFLATRAAAAGDHAGTAKYLSKLMELDDISPPELDQLATAQFRIGEYAAAAKAWKQAAIVDPTDKNRPRYCARLAELAAAGAPIPGLAPDGTPWDQMTKEALETLLKEQAQVVRDTVAEAMEAETLTTADKAGYKARLNEIQGVFAAAGMEYAQRRYGIREASFFGGFAPVILNPGSWKISRRPDDAKERKNKKKTRRAATGF